MPTTLVVVRPFGTRSIGDLIIVPADVAQTLASEHTDYVVKMNPPSSTQTGA